MVETVGWGWRISKPKAYSLKTIHLGIKIIKSRKMIAIKMNFSEEGGE
jgi:hypothetical protein